jgi:8-oxo-dGTP pyrophosphatase MutT (NUDIX family)
MLRFHSVGNWSERQVFGGEAPSTRLIVPQVEKIIDETWQTARSQPGVNLFDGPMCRLESWEATAERLALRFSHTSYKPFVGTNLYHADLADQYGPEILANPVGVSPALETSDGWLMLGRRNATVAYYPHRIHPFAGALEPRDGSDVFRAVERELAEELGLTPGAIRQIHCVGIAEDQRLRQTELIFSVQVDLSRGKIEAGVKKDEHHESWSVLAQSAAIDAVLADGEVMTPVATAALLLWGRQKWGTGWFDQRCPEGRYAPPNRGGSP